MADISIPQSQSYYRIGYRNPTAFTGTMYFNRLDVNEMHTRVDQLQSVSDNEIVSVEWIDVHVTVTEVKEIVLQ